MKLTYMTQVTLNTTLAYKLKAWTQQHWLSKPTRGLHIHITYDSLVQKSSIT